MHAYKCDYTKKKARFRCACKRTDSYPLGLRLKALKLNARVTARG